jgi:dihydrodipicolinate synthase/N-acetylneuraminate lyase
MQEIEGVYVANVTPFEDDGSLTVDEDAYLDHVLWLAEMGVRGIVPFGTNGEGPSVTLGEKLRVLEALFGRGFPIQIIPAVMQNNLPETLEMLRILEDYPAAAVLVLPPYYFKPVEPEGMMRFYEIVLEIRRACSRSDGETTPRLGRQGLGRGGRLRRGRSRRRQRCAPRYGG